MGKKEGWAGIKKKTHPAIPILGTYPEKMETLIQN